jgi:hypothetical protein
MAGPRRRLLPHPEVPRGARRDAGAPDLVQVGELRDMGFRGRASGGGLLGGGGAVPDRAGEGRSGGLAGDPDLGRLARGGLGGLRPPLQVAARRQPDRADAPPLRASRRDGMGLRPDLHGARGASPSRRLHGDDHVGERVLHHHSEPEDRGGGSEGGADARPEIRQDREAQVDPQQLSDPAGRVPDAVEPLSARLRDRVELGDREPRLPHGRDDPALLQLDACAQGATLVDLGRDRGDLHRHHVAVDGGGEPVLGGGLRAPDDRRRTRLRRGRGLRGRPFHRARPLLDVPRARAELGGARLGAEGRLPRTRTGHRARGAGDLPAGGRQPRDAARQPHLDGARGARDDRPLVPERDRAGNPT